ncbi:MAG: DUF104 domain-containing protein [Oscillospiraceae bacterium]|nr:DUF104 domain-containing protein [Oscillospiraceae bacterium]
MQTINAIFDGNYFKPIEPIPFKGKYEVIITFIKPIDVVQSKRQRILNHFGTWTDSDIDAVNEIVQNRENFFAGRDNL